MFDKDFMNSVIMVATGVGAICATVYACYISKKMDTLATRLNTSVDKIAENVEVKADEALIEEATHKAVEREVSKSASAIVRRVGDDIERVVRDEGEKEFKRCRGDMAVKIAGRVDELIQTIDTNDLSEIAVNKLIYKLEDKIQTKATAELVKRAEPTMNSYATAAVSTMKAMNMLKNAASGVDLPF